MHNLHDLTEAVFDVGGEGEGNIGGEVGDADALRNHRDRLLRNYTHCLLSYLPLLGVSFDASEVFDPDKGLGLRSKSDPVLLLFIADRVLHAVRLPFTIGVGEVTAHRWYVVTDRYLCDCGCETQFSFQQEAVGAGEEREGNEEVEDTREEGERRNRLAAEPRDGGDVGFGPSDRAAEAV